MNYFAHLHLALLSQHSLQGALLGDEIKGNQWQQFAPAIQQAIRQHRAIDTATDHHPFTVAQRQRFAQGERRYAGIVLDLATDYWLSRNWAFFETRPLDEFVHELHQRLKDEWQTYGLNQYPGLDRYQRRLTAMTEQYWLTGYGDRHNIERALSGIEQRLRRSPSLPNLFRQLPEHNQAFCDFYTDMIRFAQQWPNTSISDGSQQFPVPGTGQAD